MSTATRGVLYVHSAPSALCPHVEWAVSRVLGVPAPLDWTAQPAEPGSHRCEVDWSGTVGVGAALTSALRGWDRLRFEVTEDPTARTEGSRWSFTPSLGVFHAVTGVDGDIMVGEDRLRAAMAKAALDGSSLGDRVHELLGTAWDDELEVFRRAGDGAPVRWLHQVG